MMKCTLVQGVEATATAQEICTRDTNDNSKRGDSDPHAERVADQVDLLAGLVLCPERNTPHQEGPLNGRALVRMRISQAGVVGDHLSLELQELEDKRSRLDRLRRLLVDLRR
jgi:hypothetical protein